MRRVTAIVAIHLVSVLLAYGANRTDREVHGLRGAVGSVRVETAKVSVSSGTIVEGPRSRTEKQVYDDKGNLTWETLYVADSLVASRYYSSQSDGTQLEIAHTRRSPASAGSPSPQSMSTSRVTWTHQSDAAGNRIESSARSADGSLVSRLVYSYGAAGKVTSVAQYGRSGAPIQKVLYNDAGDVNERYGFDDKGAAVALGSYTYKYDGEGNWIQRITTYANGAGQPLGDPVEVTYRTINYYPPVGDFQMNGGVVPGGLPKSTSGQSLLSGQAIRRVEAVYPVAARAAHISGIVAVELTVDEEGDVLSARVISGHPLLREAALDAAWDWKFSPTMYLGKAVKVVGAIDFNFNM